MLAIVSLELNKFWNRINFKKVTIIGGEITFFLISVIKSDFAWFFSFNISLFWYLIVFFFWALWLKNIFSLKRGKWPILLFFGIIKLVIYTLPFFVVWIGDTYLPNTIFQIETSIFALMLAFWILIIDYWKEWAIWEK